MGYKTDKAREHSYGPFYDELFSRYGREDKLDILEIGVQGGGSLLAWKDYFPNANVVGVDISDSRLDEYKSDRVTFIKSDVRDVPATGKYDIIIDDSDHFIGTQKFIVENYYPMLKSGGTLVIEDVQSGDNDVSEISGVLPVSAAMDWVDLRSVVGRYDDFLITVKAP